MQTSKFTTTALLVLTSLSIFATGSISEARDRVDRRQGRQSARVKEGIRSDEITAAEAHRLQQSKRAIRRVERRSEKDGVVTEKESARLENLQDARSKQIKRLKHNDRTQSPSELIAEPPAAPVETQPAPAGGK